MTNQIMFKLQILVCLVTINWAQQKCQIRYDHCTAETYTNKHCVFPFTNRGKIYSSCIPLISGKSWCSLTANYDKDKRKDFCRVQRCRTVCLYLDSVRRTWSHASISCKLNGGNLVTIQNRLVQMLVSRMLTLKTQWIDAWIGGKQFVTPWMWDSGTVGAPGTTVTPRCAVIENGTFFSQDCTDQHTFICKTELSNESCRLPLYHLYRRHCYHVSSSRLSWFNARHECQSRHQGQLISLTQKGMDGIITSLLMSLNIRQQTFWIGASTRKWVWMADGSSISYTSWAPRHPRQAHESCLAVSQPVYNWVDEECSVGPIALKPCVCQKVISSRTTPFPMIATVTPAQNNTSNATSAVHSTTHLDISTPTASVSKLRSSENVTESSIMMTSMTIGPTIIFYKNDGQDTDPVSTSGELLTPELIAGIAGGGVFLIMLICLLIVIIIFMKRSKRKNECGHENAVREFERMNNDHVRINNPTYIKDGVNSNHNIHRSHRNVPRKNLTPENPLPPFHEYCEPTTISSRVGMLPNSSYSNGNYVTEKAEDIFGGNFSKSVNDINCYEEPCFDTRVASRPARSGVLPPFEHNGWMSTSFQDGENQYESLYVPPTLPKRPMSDIGTGNKNNSEIQISLPYRVVSNTSSREQSKNSSNVESKADNTVMVDNDLYLKDKTNTDDTYHMPYELNTIPKSVKSKPKVKPKPLPKPRHVYEKPLW